MSNEIVKIDTIASKIFIIRNVQVILDSDLAQMYNVSTGRLNEQVKRNIERFPDDFMFQLTDNEWQNLMSQNATSNWGGRRKLPYVFTEQGIATLSGVLKSEVAVKANIAIMRAFVRMREMLLKDKKMAARLDDFEDRLGANEMQTLSVLDQLGTIKKTLKPAKKTNVIGFHHK